MHSVQPLRRQASHRRINRSNKNPEERQQPNPSPSSQRSLTISDWYPVHPPQIWTINDNLFNWQMAQSLQLLTRRSVSISTFCQQPWMSSYRRQACWIRWMSIPTLSWYWWHYHCLPIRSSWPNRTHKRLSILHRMYTNDNR